MSSTTVVEPTGTHLLHVLQWSRGLQDNVPNFFFIHMQDSEQFIVLD